MLKTILTAILISSLGLCPISAKAMDDGEFIQAAAAVSRQFADGLDVRDNTITMRSAVSGARPVTIRIQMQGAEPRIEISGGPLNKETVFKPDLSELRAALLQNRGTIESILTTTNPDNVFAQKSALGAILADPLGNLAIGILQAVSSVTGEPIGADLQAELAQTQTETPVQSKGKVGRRWVGNQTDVQGQSRLAKRLFNTIWDPIKEVAHERVNITKRIANQLAYKIPSLVGWGTYFVIAPIFIITNSFFLLTAGYMYSGSDFWLTKFVPTLEIMIGIVGIPFLASKTLKLSRYMKALAKQNIAEIDEGVKPGEGEISKMVLSTKEYLQKLRDEDKEKKRWAPHLKVRCGLLLMQMMEKIGP